MKTKQIIATALVGTALYLAYKKYKNQPTKPKSLFNGSNFCLAKNNANNIDDFNSSVKNVVNATTRAFGVLTIEQEKNIGYIIDAFNKLGDCDNAKLAYILATAWHESRFRTVRECFAKNDAAARACVSNRAYGKVVNGQVYYGRGFSQLTWDYNYRTFGQLLGIDLYNNPDLAMNPVYAAEILVIGMVEGRFTYKKLEKYITPQQWDFFNARRTVNALDKASQIKGYAEKIINA